MLRINRRWDAEEDLTLRAWANLENISEITARLDRTESSVKSRMRTLGIKKKKVYKPNRTWTDKEVKYLRRMSGEMKSDRLAEKLNKSLSSVKLKASRLGLSLRTSKNSSWCDSDIDQLINLISTGKNWFEISDVLVDRTWMACRKKAGELDLNLGLKREWRMSELRYLHQARSEGIPYKKISLELNRSVSSVRKRYARYKKEKGL